MGNIVTFNGFGAIPELLREEAARIVRETAEGVVQQAQALAPVDTGALRDSIRVAAGELTDGESIDSMVEVDVPYALFVEYGTVRHPAQPFLTPAIEGARTEFEARMIEAMERQPNF